MGKILFTIKKKIVLPYIYQGYTILRACNYQQSPALYISIHIYFLPLFIDAVSSYTLTEELQNL